MAEGRGQPQARGFAANLGYFGVELSVALAIGSHPISPSALKSRPAQSDELADERVSFARITP